MSNCRYCNEPLPIKKGRGRKRKYCGDNCRYSYWDENQDKKKQYGKVCLYCGKIFQTWLKNIKYCSQKCSGRLLGDKRIQEALDEVISGYKTCRRCFILKPLPEFNYSKNNAAGYSSICKSCQSQWWKKYISNPENKERKLEKNRQWNYVNRERTKQNKAAYLPRRLELEQIQRDCDPMFRLNNSMRVGIWHSLKDIKGGHSWETFVDFTLDDLRKHLEALFTGGMTWDNYGEWWVDHIIPKWAFNFDSPDHPDFKRCWRLDNLQPLWAKDNMSKGASLKEPFQPSLI